MFRFETADKTFGLEPVTISEDMIDRDIPSKYRIKVGDKFVRGCYGFLTVIEITHDNDLKLMKIVVMRADSGKQIDIPHHIVRRMIMCNFLSKIKTKPQKGLEHENSEVCH